MSDFFRTYGDKLLTAVIIHLGYVLISVVTIPLFFFTLYLRGFSIRIGSLYIILSSFIFFLATYLVNYEFLAHDYVRSGLQFFVAYCIPLIIFVPLLTGADSLLNGFYQASYFMALVALVTFVLILLGARTVQGYSMSYGANTMVPTIFLFSKAFREDSFKDYVLAGACTVAVFVLGSRWPLICIGVFVIYGFTQKMLEKEKRRIAAIGLMAAIFLLIVTSYTEITTGLSIILDRFGLNSRTISLLLSGNIAYDSGRLRIHQQTVLKLSKSPLLGYGAFGGVTALGGESPHSLFLDTWANFGYFAGSVVLFYSIYMTITRFWINRGSSYGEMVAIYACMVWPRASIGGSFWTMEPYWMLISLFLLGNSCHARNQRGASDNARPN